MTEPSSFILLGLALNLLSMPQGGPQSGNKDYLTTCDRDDRTLGFNPMEMERSSEEGVAIHISNVDRTARVWAIVRNA